MKCALFVWFCCLAAVNGAKILGIHPRAAISHFSFCDGIMRSLHAAGHEITFINPFLETQKIAENFTTINSKLNSTVHVGTQSMDNFVQMYGYQMQTIMIQMEGELCNNVMRIKEIQDALSSKDKRFDLIFAEMLYMYECFLIIAEKLQIPVIVTVPTQLPPLTWVAEPTVQNPFNPAVIPHFRTYFGRAMTFHQRLINTLTTLLLDAYSSLIISPKLNRFKHEHFGLDTEAIRTKAPALVFINSHSIMHPRPMIPNSIEIAGIHLKPTKPLPKVCSHFLRICRHSSMKLNIYGVILVSFGSVLKGTSMPMKIRLAFVDAFANIPQRVIWKFEGAVEGITDNVMLSSWIPQRDILEHKNVKAFVSHCGISGVIEALQTGTPVIAAPLIGDQRTNAALLEDLGVALHLDLMSTTKKAFLDVIETIINDTRYYEKMQEVSEIFKDRPMSPQETVVYWTEYVLRHNGAIHLQTAAADMPFYKYLLLDIIFFAVLAVITIFWILYNITKKMYSFFYSKLEYPRSIAQKTQ